MTDHRGLIESVRAEHQPCADRDRCPEPRCVMCTEDWPCSAVRLADALEDAIPAQPAADSGVPTKQLHQGTHRGFNPRRTGL